jgi:signal transduction histidine kinase
MSNTGAAVPGLEPGSPGATPQRTGARHELVRDVRLWITLGLVALFAVVWQAVLVLVNHPLYSGSTNFLPLGIFLVPVLYASITFGLGGGLVVAITSAVATVPWVFESVSRGNQLGAWFDFVQVLVLLVVAYFVGKAVRSERQARQRAERSRQDHLLAEIRYRDLFDTNSQPILLADLAGVVHEANVAAQDLFGGGTGSLSGARLPDLLGKEVFAALRADRPTPARVEMAGKADGAPVVFRPAGRLVTVDGEPMVQVVLQDVTEDSRRRQLAQAYAADVLRGQEDERRRIAQELHDGPLQTLVHICRLIDSLGAGGQAAAPAPADLAQLRSTTESVVAEVRQISRGLRPPLLDDLGLLAALQRLCDDVERRAGVAVSLRVHGPVPRLAPPVELTVYRIAQEALSNVDRHAGASTVEVRLWTGDDRLELRVIDDGEGFDAGPGGATSKGTLGLAGMSERAALVGGSLQVYSQPGGGTTVAAAVPVLAVADPQPAMAQPPPAQPAPGRPAAGWSAGAGQAARR